MNKQTRNIINWLLAGIVAAVFINAAYGKFTSGEESYKQIVLGGIEISAVILFIIPRTAILGTLLLVAYMGGAIATKLEQERPLLSTIMVSSLVWIAAVVRNPELSQRILKKRK
jgi:UPF0716 family protein affecting phage T7 exclusion